MNGARLFLIVMLAWSAPDTAADSGATQGNPYHSTYRPLPRQDFAVTGATLLDGAGGRLEDADILVMEGVIAAVGIDLELPPDVKIIEADGRWLTPGIIDIHSHDGTYLLPLAASLSDISEVSSPNVAETRIEDAINVQDPAFIAALQSGVTTVQVLPGSVPLFGGRTAVLKTVPGRTVYDMKFPDAPAGLKMACGENPKSAFGERGVAPTSRQGEIAAMRSAWIEAAAYRAHKPPERDLALETLAGVLEGKVRVHIHCYRADDIAVMLRIAREFDFRIAAIHHAAEAYKIADELAAADVCTAVWSDWWGFKMEVADGIRQNAAYLSAAGACTIMHSDSPLIGQRLVVEAAKAMAAGRDVGLTFDRAEAIRWVTSYPARALGLEKRIGRLADGYNADIVLWSGDPFSIYNKPDRVYVDGGLAYDRSDPAHQPHSDILLGYPAREGGGEP